MLTEIFYNYQVYVLSIYGGILTLISERSALQEMAMGWQWVIYQSTAIQLTIRLLIIQL